MNKKAYRVLAFARTERGEEQLAKKKAAIARSRPFSSGGRIRTYDLRVMSANPKPGTLDHHSTSFEVT